MSCTGTGAGGFTGCGLKEIDAAYAEKAQDPGKNFGRLIAEKRRERLAGIDAESRKVEEEVKKYEAEQAERKARQEAADRGEVYEDSEDGAAESEPLPQPK
jgi:hypothetical protein